MCSKTARDSIQNLVCAESTAEKASATAITKVSIIRTQQRYLPDLLRVHLAMLNNGCIDAVSVANCTLTRIYGTTK